MMNNIKIIIAPTYYGPGTLRTFYIFSNLIFTTILRINHYCPHFTEEKTLSQRDSESHKVVRGAGFEPRSA